MGTNRGLLDPRTKLLLVFIEAVLVLATSGGDRLMWFRAFFTLLPFLLLIISKRYKTFCIGVAVLAAVWTLKWFVYPNLSGVGSYALLAVITLVTRFLPAYMMGAYVIRTTKVSEFKAAMEKMHVPDELTIPMCVMFRFFPTVQEEYASIKSAMKMRGISFGGRKASEILEYRLVPMLSCSAKIGEELSASALTRGLGISRRRTNICKIGFSIFDWIVFALVISMLAYWVYGVIV